MGHLTALCRLAAAASVHVELVAGDTLYKNGEHQWRKIRMMRLAHESGRVFAQEQMGGVEGIDRAAAKLIEHLESHPAGT